MTAIELKPVESSNIEAIGHDPAAREMHVRFKPGKDGKRGVYIYAEVPEEVHSDWLAAESIGKHFHANIKGKFAHRFVADPEEPVT